MTKANIKIVLIEILTSAVTPLLFKHIPYIYHPVWFKKNQTPVQALLDFDSEINVMISIYATSLGLKIRSINFKV